jgi:Protoglobin
MESGSVYQRLLDFLEIDGDTQARAKRLGRFLEPHLDSIIESFYAKVMAAHISSHVNLATVENLKASQKRHWRALFETTFNEDYIDSVRRVSAKHRDIDLDPMWYIAGYAMLKIEFTTVIVKAGLPIAEKGHLIKTLDKYVAIDMGLSLSTAFVD